jgi:hypothetical protein
MHLPICLRWLGCSTALIISVDLLSKGAIVVRCFQLKTPSRFFVQKSLVVVTPERSARMHIRP